MRLLTSIAFVLPASGLKNLLLRLLGHSIAAGVRIGPSLAINVRRFSLGEHAHIGVGNVFRDLKMVALDDHARIGQWNWVTATLTVDQKSGEDHESREDAQGDGTLRMGRHCAVVSRHYLDCSGGIEIAPFAVVAGLRSVFLTHQVDYRSAKQTTAGIRVGAYALVNACNKLVPGANVPANSVTTTGAVILPGLLAEGRLYGGVPARDIKAVDGAWFDRLDGRVGL